jgi:hypothetical protein
MNLYVSLSKMDKQNKNMSTQNKLIWTRLDGKRYNPSKMLRQEGFFDTYLEKFATLEDVEEWKNNFSLIQKQICRDVYINKILEGDPLPVREGMSSYQFEIRVKGCRYRNKQRIDRLKFDLQLGLVYYGTWTTVTVTTTPLLSPLRTLSERAEGEGEGDGEEDAEVVHRATTLLDQIKEQLRWNTQNIRRNKHHINRNKQHLARVVALQEEANRFIFGPGRTRSRAPQRSS